MIKPLIKQLGAVILYGCLLGMPIMAAAKAPQESLDHIVVIVNDGAITQSELNQELSMAKKQLLSANTPLPAADVLRKQVLDQLINRKLQLQIAAQAGVKVSDDAVNKAIDTIAKNNKVTTAELYQKVGAEGVNATDYRQEIHDQLTMQRIQQQEVVAKMAITPEEVKSFMRSKAWQQATAKEYHLEDILIALSDTPSPQDIAAAKTRAEAVIAKIRQGMNFKSAAAAESGDSKALEGGDLGWRKLPEIPSAFAAKISAMKQNDIVGPIQTANGFHILHLAGIRNAGGAGEPSKKQLEDLLFQRKFAEALQTWLMKLRSQAFINMHPE